MKALLILLLFGSLTQAATLKNGSPLEVEVDSRMPRQLVIYSFAGGAQKIETKKQGSLAVLMNTLSEGPTGTDTAAFKKELYLLGAELSFRAGARSFYVSLRVPPQNLKAAVELLKKNILQPKLDDATIGAMKSKTLSLVKTNFESMRTVAFHQAVREVYPNTPEAWDGSPTPQSVTAIDAESVRKSFEALLQWNTLAVFTVGPVALKKLQDELLITDTKYKKPVASKPINGEALKPVKNRAVLIRWEGATDSQVLYLFPEALDPCGKPQAIALIAHHLLGGGVGGILAQELRVKKGLTYHAGSKPDAFLPHWMIWTFGDPKNVKALAKGSLDTVEEFKKMKVSKTDFENAKAFRVSEIKSDLELPEDTLIYRLNQTLMGCKQPVSAAMLEQVTLVEVQKFIQTKLDTKRGVLTVVGDSKKSLPVIKELSYLPEDIKEMTLEQLW